MNYLADAIEAFANRVRSPLLGSCILAFILINWKVLYVILFSAYEPVAKFEYFDANTDNYSLFVWPLSVGLLVGLFAPWLTLFGSWAASQPIQKQRIMADRLSSERLLQRAKLAKAREYEQSVIEQALIERAKRDEEIDNIEDDEKRKLLKDQVQQSRKDAAEKERLLDELAEAEQTRDQAIGYLQQRENELTQELSETKVELQSAMEFIRKIRMQEKLKGRNI